MGFGKDGYYSLREILGYNCKYNIILSERGIGKSYGTKLFLMAQEGTAMCLYRTGPDMSSAMLDWTDPLIREGYEAEDFVWEGNERDGFILSYQGRPKIWFRAISQVNRVKQEIFPDDMCWVWWDEFIPLAWKKIPGIESEGDALRTIVKTIEHDTIRSREDKGLKPLRVLMFANPFTWNNPLLSYFHVDPRTGPGVHRAGPGVAFEIVQVSEKPRTTGKMDVEEFLGNDVHKNQGWLSEDAFVADVPRNSVPTMSVRLGRRYFLVMRAPSGVQWIVEKRAHTDVRKQVGRKAVLMRFGTLSGLQEDEGCLDRVPLGKRLKEWTYQGVYRYDSLNTKFDWLRALDEY